MRPFYAFSDAHNNPFSVALVDAQNYPVRGMDDPDIEAFFSIYQKITQNQQEHAQVITDRLKHKTEPHTYLAICRDETTLAVIGGYILEYYEKSKFCLLSYIFIESAYQGQGKQIGIKLGESLQDLVILILKDEQNKEVKTVLFEMAAKREYLDIVRYAPAARFFSKIDGVWIDIPYVEPVSKSSDYLLGAIPIAGNLRDTITQLDVYQFLHELYSLYSSKNNKDILEEPFYQKHIAPWQIQSGADRIKITERIKEFPRLVQPRLRLSKASIALHLIQEKGTMLDVDTLKKNKHVYDSVFNSFEKDLFSQKFVEDPPYYSKQVDVQYASVHFNNLLNFNSEGRVETLILVDADNNPLTASYLEKRIKVYLNHTVFTKKNRIKGGAEGNFVVWELVISPIDAFNEYEFIQLEKYFTGKQESFNLDITFLFNKVPCIDLFDFAQKLIGNNVELRREVLAGTIQIDTSQLTYVAPKQPANPQLMNTPDSAAQNKHWTWPQVYQYYNSEPLAQKNSEGADKLQLIYTDFPDARYMLNTLCGIALGIFDFERMSIEEVNDTLIPIRKTDSYFVILNKSSIACFCDDNEIYTNALKYGIGINPYLIIPNAVLAYNSFLTLKVFENTAKLRSSHADLATPSEIGQWNRKMTQYLLKTSLSDGTDRLSELIEQKEHIASFLNNIIPNVYQYETERKLYSDGMEKRGIIEKGRDIEEYKKEVEEQISHLNNERANLLGKLSLILGIISLSQIYQFFDSMQNLFMTKETGLAKYISLVFTLLLFIFFIYFTLKNYRITLSPKDRFAST